MSTVRFCLYVVNNRFFLYLFWLFFCSLSKELFENLLDPSLENWDEVKTIQREWIGDCNGYIIEMKLVDSSQRQIDEIDHLPVWMSQPEYLNNVAFLAIKSDNLLNREINRLITVNKSTLLNIKAIDPITRKCIPIVVNDQLNYEEDQDIYVGIPSLNEEDRKIVSDMGIDSPPQISEKTTPERKTIIAQLKRLNGGGYESSARLKDWLISRQRYWGTPIPIIYCSDCGTVPVPEEDLPVQLPKIKGSIIKGNSVLEEIEEWYRCSCPRLVFLLFQRLANDFLTYTACTV